MLSTDLAAAPRVWGAAQGRLGGARSRPSAWPNAAGLILPFLGILLAACSLLPPASAQVAMLAVIIVFGVPHGALDGEIVRPLLRPALGAAWFLVFALPYLGLSALVLLAWQGAPVITLAAFLSLSVLHFGLEDAGADPLAVIVRGGLPIALPVLLHPAATAAVFGAIAIVPMPAPPPWLMIAAQSWAVLVPLWLVKRRDDREALSNAALLAAAFALLPPLAAFSIYFVCFHAPAHTRSLVRNRRSPRVHSMSAAARRSVPVTLLTIAIGAALWPLVGAGRFDAHLLSLTIRCLAALTLPHMLLDVVSATPAWRRMVQGT